MSMPPSSSSSRRPDEDTLATLAPLVEVGLNHEQQHQELMLTDILHAFAQNPIPPAYDPSWRFPASTARGEEWLDTRTRASTPSATATTASISTTRSPRIARWSARSRSRAISSPMANGSPSCEDGGYATADAVADGRLCRRRPTRTGRRPAIGARSTAHGTSMTLGGLQPVDPDAPVCHVSYYEADAFARWAGKHLPTEMEWEVAARAGQLNDAFGIVWQWTRSVLLALPRLSRHRRRARRIQRQVHGQPAGAARLLACNPGRATAVSPIATSSIRTIAGNSRDCGSPTTPDFIRHHARRTAFRRRS